MIYTVTFNPSLDYIINLDEFQLGTINRTQSEHIFCGGKGINVAIVLKNLGIPSVALGFIAGFTGKEIEKKLHALNCHSNFIELTEGLSRINVKIKAKQESEINGQGPFITTAALNRLFTQLDALTSQDILVLAGSIPANLPADIYEKIMERLHDKQIKIIVDATCALLMNVIKYQPFLIKPNHHELGEMFNKKLHTPEEIIFYAKELQRQGAQNVLVSMAGEGAILVAADQQIYQSPAPKGVVVNSVGAGDSMVAGFLSGFLETGKLETAFKMGIATGSASAFSAELATRTDVENLLHDIQANKL